MIENVTIYEKDDIVVCDYHNAELVSFFDANDELIGYCTIGEMLSCYTEDQDDYHKMITVKNGDKISIIKEEVKIELFDWAVFTDLYSCEKLFISDDKKIRMSFRDNSVFIERILSEEDYSQSNIFNKSCFMDVINTIESGLNVYEHTNVYELGYDNEVSITLYDFKDGILTITSGIIFSITINDIKRIIDGFDSDDIII